MAKIYFGEGNIINNKISIPLYVDTEGESLNAFEIKIKLSDNLIFRDWNSAGSIINFWVEKPSIQNNILQFSGVSIGGYVGKKGLLAELVFEAKKEMLITKNEMFLEILPSSKGLLNDGLGTEVKLTTESKVLKIGELKTAQVSIDQYPPESFKIYLYKDREIFNGKYFIVFQTTDKQTGIAYYEIAEKQSLLKPDIKDLNFEKAEPPYLLRDQTLRSYIFVKAIDKFGNERIEYLKPQRIVSFDEILTLLILGIIIFFLIKLIKSRWKLKI